MEIVRLTQSINQEPMAYKEIYYNYYMSVFATQLNIFAYQQQE